MVALGQFSWDLSLNVLPPHFLSHTMLGSKKMIIDKRHHDFERAGTEQVISMQHIKDSYKGRCGITWYPLFFRALWSMGWMEGLVNFLFLSQGGPPSQNTVLVSGMSIRDTEGEGSRGTKETFK
jgi:hypothetical protein